MQNAHANREGEDSEPVEEVHYFLCCSDLVTVTPELEFAASPNPVREGGTPLLTCTITAVPAANFSEILRVRADGTEESVANVSNSADSREFAVTYPFANVRSPRDNGTVFRCRATNVNGDAQADVSITVEGELYIEYLIYKRTLTLSV